MQNIFLMEYKTITKDQIWSSSAATILVLFFQEQTFSSGEYDIEQFKQDFEVFLQANRPMICSMGFDSEYIHLFNFDGLNHASLFRQILTRFENENSHQLSKIFSDFILKRNIEEGRPILNMRASRTDTTSKMYESAPVDKTELMFY